MRNNVAKVEALASKLLVKACNMKLTSKANCSSSIYMYEMEQPKTLKRFKK